MAQEIYSNKLKCGFNKTRFSGIIKVEVAEVDWISVFPEIMDAYKYMDSFSFISNRDWLDMGAIQDSGSYKETGGSSKSDTSVKTDLVFDTNGDEHLITQLMDILSRKCVIVKATFKNGSIRILGELGVCPNPIVPVVNSEIGKTTVDFNGHTIAFSWLATHRPYFI